MEARLAQSVEHETLNLRVVGSSPTLGVQIFALEEKCVFFYQTKKRNIFNTNHFRYVIQNSRFMQSHADSYCNTQMKNTTRPHVLLETIDAHGLEIQGRWYLKFFFRINCQGGPPISGFIAFLLTSVLKFA